MGLSIQLFQPLAHCLWSSFVFVRDQWLFLFKFCLFVNHLFSSHGFSIFLYFIWRNVSVICLGVISLLMRLHRCSPSWISKEIFLSNLWYSQSSFLQTISLLQPYSPLFLEVCPCLRWSCRTFEVCFFVFNNTSATFYRCCDQIPEKKQLRDKKGLFWFLIWGYDHHEQKDW